jgi:membrane peptidoglycan carboxypeptidase
MFLEASMKTLGQLIAFTFAILQPNTWKKFQPLLAISFDAYASGLRYRLPSILVSALVLGEDHRFHSHAGVDPVAIVSATWRLLRWGRVSGASTVEQQLVRVLTGDRRRTISRKVREISLACTLDTLCEKSEIAGMYLAVAYFGWQMNGLEEACRRMCIDLLTITPRQAAGLVARLKYPEPSCPSPQREALIARRTEYLLALLSPNDTALAKLASSNAALLDN